MTNTNTTANPAINVTVTVVPAYGRDYKNKAEALAAWEAGKDFEVYDMFSRWNGAKINKEDSARFSVGTVNLRYSKLSKVAVIKVR